MLNGPGRAYVERAGRLEAVELDLDAGGIVRLVERVVAPLGLRLDRASPMVDARLADGSRLHALIPPLALDGPCVGIRRFRARPVDLEAFGATGAPGAFLRWAVAAGWNLLISGGTARGKTTLLNSLSAAIPAGEASSPSRRPPSSGSLSRVVRLERRPQRRRGGRGERAPPRACALRMRRTASSSAGAGRRGARHAQALNTGHDGSLSTVHANGPADVLPRLETLVLMAGAGLPLAAVRSQIGAAIDAVVHVTRAAAGAARRGDREAREHGRRPRRPLFERRAGDLVPSAPQAPRRPGALTRQAVVRMLSVALAVAGPIAVAALVSGARRAGRHQQARARAGPAVAASALCRPSSPRPRRCRPRARSPSRRSSCGSAPPRPPG